jgi:rhamnosyl/mannosyltransferase
MKIIHSYKDYWPVVGGIENHLRMIAGGLKNIPDIEQTVLVEQIDSVRVIKAARWLTVSRAPIAPSLTGWMGRLTRGADVAHLHFPYPIGEMAYLAAGRAKKLVLTYHSDIVRQKNLLRVYRPFLLRILQKADVITVSNPQYIQSSPFLQPHAAKCVVVPHGQDTARFANPWPQVKAAASDIRQTYPGPIVLFVGLLRYYKGVSFLAEAMKDVSATLLLVGEGPEGEALRAQVAQAGLGGKVKFLGRVKDDELAALYQACVVFVLPSIERSESLGAVQIEAMAAGKPVVCTELGTGTTFVNLDGVTGLVAPPRDAPALAAAINRLLSDPDLRGRLGAGAQRRALTEFTKEKMVERLDALYRSTLAA